jgi:hypothetical protein
MEIPLILYGENLNIVWRSLTLWRSLSYYMEITLTLYRDPSLILYGDSLEYWRSLEYCMEILYGDYLNIMEIT